MQLHIAFNPEPEPMPSMSPLPDIGQVTDFSTAISGIVGTVLLVVVGLAWMKARRWVEEVILDVKATKAQTVNSHKTNLRDDLTLAIAKIDEVATEVKGVKETQSSMETQQTAMSAQQGVMYEDLRDTRRDVRFNIEYTRDVDKRLIEHERRRDNKEEGSS